MADIGHFKIPIFDFQVDPNDDDDELIQESYELRSQLPFTIIGMEHEVNEGGIMN